jgi:tetratricopeptide (TPR) repeat protein
VAAFARRHFAILLLLLVAVVLLPNEVAVWVDGEGRTWLSDREDPAPGAQRVSPEDLAIHWDGRRLGAPLPRGTSSSNEGDRYLSAVLAARADVERGDLQTGLRALRRLQRDQPTRPEAALLLAQVERHRGRLEPAREALDAVLSTASGVPDRWRDAATRERNEIDQELALARARTGQIWQTRTLESTHFLITYDHQFAGRAYGDQVLGVLEQARASMQSQLGRTLSRPLEVRLYTRAHYLEAYQHRFGFATVGFYDGAIHVVSAKRPRNELYALIVHEYAHALFQEATGSHQPFFLNEGIADRAEEAARGRPNLSREEWRRLLDAIRTREWIPLESLVQGFSGLKGSQALLAYLESRAAIELIERERPGAVAAFLDGCASGREWPDSLRAATGWDTRGLERALQAEVLSRFPSDPLASASPQ